MKIRLYPDPVLSMVALPVDKFDRCLERLGSRMIKTLKRSGGLGLAANQVGETKRMIAIGTKYPVVVVNPVIETMEGEQENDEQCMSIPGICVKKKRAFSVLLKGKTTRNDDLNIEADGLLAAVIQHEVDHLNGVTLLSYE